MSESKSDVETKRVCSGYELDLCAKQYNICRKCGRHKGEHCSAERNSTAAMRKEDDVIPDFLRSTAAPATEHVETLDEDEQLRLAIAMSLSDANENRQCSAEQNSAAARRKEDDGIQDFLRSTAAPATESVETLDEDEQLRLAIAMSLSDANENRHSNSSTDFTWDDFQRRAKGLTMDEKRAMYAGGKTSNAEIRSALPHKALERMIRSVGDDLLSRYAEHGAEATLEYMRERIRTLEEMQRRFQNDRSGSRHDAEMDMAIAMSRLDVSNSAGRVPDCPEKHGLSEFRTPVDDYTCDVCSANQKAGSVMFGCRACNYDVCTKCMPGMPSHRRSIPLCRHYARGYCRYGARCRFRHVDEEDRCRDIPLCRHYARGDCRYGARCRFRHINDADAATKTTAGNSSGDEEDDDDDDDCSICLCAKTDPVRVQPCNHAFCRSCITKWTSEPRSNANKCPICRTVMSAAFM